MGKNFRLTIGWDLGFVCFWLWHPGLATYLRIGGFRVPLCKMRHLLLILLPHRTILRIKCHVTCRKRAS